MSACLRRRPGFTCLRYTCIYLWTCEAYAHGHKFAPPRSHRCCTYAHTTITQRVGRRVGLGGYRSAAVGLAGCSSCDLVALEVFCFAYMWLETGAPCMHQSEAWSQRYVICSNSAGNQQSEKATLGPCHVSMRRDGQERMQSSSSVTSCAALHPLYCS